MCNENVLAKYYIHYIIYILLLPRCCPSLSTIMWSIYHRRYQTAFFNVWICFMIYSVCITVCVLKLKLSLFYCISQWKYTYLWKQNMQFFTLTKYRTPVGPPQEVISLSLGECFCQVCVVVYRLYLTLYAFLIHIIGTLWSTSGNSWNHSTHIQYTCVGVHDLQSLWRYYFSSRGNTAVAFWVICQHTHCITSLVPNG